MTDFDDWNADMDAWGLVGAQRVHHLWRLHAYHRRLEDWHWRKYERIDTVQAVIALAFIVMVSVTALAMVR